MKRTLRRKRLIQPPKPPRVAIAVLLRLPVAQRLLEWAEIEGKAVSRLVSEMLEQAIAPDLLDVRTGHRKPKNKVR